MKAEIQFGRSRIPYAIRRSSRRKTIGVTVSADGVEVVAPPEVTPETISERVRSKGAWIVRQMRALDDVDTPVTRRMFEEGESLLYLGKNFRIRYLDGTGAPRIRLRSGWFDVEGNRENWTWGAIAQAFSRWYADHARKYLEGRMERVAARLGVPKPPLHLRKQAKRWGSCTKTGQIFVNWQLIAAPPRIIDYVLAHECCHLLDHTHGPEFQRLITRLAPDYLALEDEIRTSGGAWVQFE